MKKVILLLMVLLSVIFVSCKKEVHTPKFGTVPVTILSNTFQDSVVIFRNENIVDTIVVSNMCNSTVTLTFYKDSTYKFYRVENGMLYHNAVKFKLLDIVSTNGTTALSCKQTGGGVSTYWSTVSCPGSNMTFYFDYH